MNFNSDEGQVAGSYRRGNELSGWTTEKICYIKTADLYDLRLSNWFQWIRMESISEIFWIGYKI